MQKRSMILRIAGLLLSLLFVVIGIVLLRRASIPAGLSLLVAGIIFFAITVIISEKTPVTEEEESNFSPKALWQDIRNFLTRPAVLPIILWMVSISSIITTLVAMSNWQRSAATNYWITAGWLSSMIAAILAMLASVRWKPARREQVREWFKTHKAEFFILLGILLAGFTLRFYLIDSHPFPWSGDEASVGIEGRRILEGEVTDFFDAGWSGQPNWSFIPTALSEIVFGENILAIRLVSIIEGTLAILFLYLLAREFFGSRVALLAAGFLAAFPYHLQFSRIGVNNIIDSLLVCLVLWLVVVAIRKGKLEYYMWAGLATGLTFYTYVGSRLVLGLAIGVLGYTVISQRGYLRKSIPHLGIYLAGIILAVAPLAFYFIKHPDVFMTRLGQESILLNDWLTLQSERSGMSQFELLWKQFKDTVLVYIAQPAVGNFFNSHKPYLTILGSVFFLFGMGYSVSRLLETRMVTLLAWFWAVVFLGGVLTNSPPANTRLVMTSPAVAIFLALGIEKFGEILSRMKLFTPRLQTIFGVILITVLGIQNATYYFGIYRTQNYFEDATGEFTQAIGLELQELGPEYDYYLFGLPRIFAAFPTVVFLAPENGMYDVDSNSIDGLTLAEGRSAIFVAIPENLADLQRVAEKFPGGTWEEIPRSFKVEVLYYAYILP